MTSSDEEPDDFDKWASQIEARLATLEAQYAAFADTVKDAISGDAESDGEPDDHAAQLKAAFRLRGRSHV